MPFTQRSDTCMDKLLLFGKSDGWQVVFQVLPFGPFLGLVHLTSPLLFTFAKAWPNREQKSLICCRWLIICRYGRWLCFVEWLWTATGSQLETLPFNCAVIVSSVPVLCPPHSGSFSQFLIPSRSSASSKKSPWNPCSHLHVLSHCSWNLPLML